MSESSNGVTVTVTPPAPKKGRGQSRPVAGTDRVRAQIEASLREVVAEAALQIGHFLHLVWVDREKGTAVVYGHLVDATECLEIAAMHLGMLKSAVAYRLLIEDEVNGPDLPF